MLRLTLAAPAQVWLGVYEVCVLIRLLSIFVSSLCAHTMQMFPYYFSLESAI